MNKERVLNCVRTNKNKESLIDLKELMECETFFILANQEDLSEFYKAYELTKDQNKTLYYGMEVQLEEKEAIHLILIAKNNQGLKELSKLLSLEKKNIKTLEKYSNIIKILTNENPTSIKPFYDFLGILNTTPKEQLLKNLNLARKQNKKVLLLNEVRYLKKEDKVAWAILMNQKIEHLKDFHFKTLEELNEDFSYLDEKTKKELLFENADHLKEQIEKITLEDLENPRIEGAREKLTKLIQENVQEKFGEKVPLEIENRINFELNSILTYHYESTYLIWSEIMKSEKSKISCSRGAVASSLIAYLLNITEFNPIEENLAPEIFYGIQFDKKPDIFINFAYNKEEILKPLQENYDIYYLRTEKVYYLKEALKKVEDYAIKYSLTLNQEEKEKLASKIVGVKMADGIYAGTNYLLPKNVIPFFLPFKTLDNKKIIQIPRENLKLISFGILEHSMMTLLKEIQKNRKEDLFDLMIDNRTLSLFNSPKSLNVTEEEIDYPLGTLGLDDFICMPFLEIKKGTIKISSKEDLMKIYGLFHGTGTWYDNAKDLLEKGCCRLKDTISSREDLLEVLLNYHFIRAKALEIMECISFGKLKEETWQEYKQLMQEKKMSEWLIESIGKIKYLFPRGHMLSYISNILRLAKVKLDYPNSFYQAYFNLNALEDKKTIEELKEAITKEPQIEEKNKLRILLESKIRKKYES